MDQARARGASRAGLVGWLLLVGIAGFVIVQTMLLQSATCEVCMQYKGLSQCRSVSGATREEARQAAITNACAFISSGVTDSMACGRGTPVSESCQ
jgi:hypothetical protein